MTEPSRKIKHRPKPRIKVIAVGVLGGLVVSALVLYVLIVPMPGKSREGPLPALSEDETSARERLRTDLEALAGRIGERNTMRPEALEASAKMIERELSLAGYEPSRQTYEVARVECSNIEAVLGGRSERSVVVGAHYDSAPFTPGANDNGTGVVALLELARRLRGASSEHTIRFVFFVNEEPPYFETDDMGSRHYANRLAERKTDVVAMLSLETMGYFSNEPGSQKYPPFFSALYPDRGNFIGFIGNTSSRSLARDAIRAFREVATIPSEGSAPPGAIPGVGWSDHASFWRHGWPAVMVTDTAPFRYPHYHEREDRVDKVDFDALARVTVGLEHVVRKLANAPK